ncbi:MAG: hypothetical protein IT201_00450 [Thermoleophilia bacterium]|nr:hypothetical protein [Thermoleophilia bacterium]
MRQKLAFLAGLGAGLALVGLLRRRRREPVAVESPAEELRRKLEASKRGSSGPEPAVGFAPASPAAEPPASPGGVDEARRRVHEAARAAAEEMRRSGTDDRTA